MVSGGKTNRHIVSIGNSFGSLICEGPEWGLLFYVSSDGWQLTVPINKLDLVLHTILLLTKEYKKNKKDS